LIQEKGNYDHTAQSKNWILPVGYLWGHKTHQADISLVYSGYIAVFDSWDHHLTFKK